MCSPLANTVREPAFDGNGSLKHAPDDRAHGTLVRTPSGRLQTPGRNPARLSHTEITREPGAGAARRPLVLQSVRRQTASYMRLRSTQLELTFAALIALFTPATTSA